MQAKRAIVVGQGGTGKTALVRYFKAHPILNWECVDFDDGHRLRPDASDGEALRTWFTEGREFWKTQLSSEAYAGQNVLLFGSGILPWRDMGALADVPYGYLVLSESERAKRLEDRGDAGLARIFTKSSPEMREIAERLDALGARRFVADGKKVEDLAQEIAMWVRSL